MRHFTRRAVMECGLAMAGVPDLGAIDPAPRSRQLNLLERAGDHTNRSASPLSRLP